MPLYYFNVFDYRQCIEDQQGVELANADQARAELHRVVDRLPDLLKRPGVRVAVYNEERELLAIKWVISPGAT